MKEFLKDYFTFNKRERRGIFILILIIIFLIFLLNIPLFFPSENESSFSRFEKEIDEFSESVDSVPDLPENSEKKGVGNYTEKFFFNPNHLPAKDWVKLGLTEKQAEAVKKFEEAGGSFSKKEDLKKIYVISQPFYNSVEPFIKIPVDSVKNKFPGIGFVKHEKKILEVDVNHADTSQFKKLKFIGSGFAKRIVKYRDALGGFATIDQLMEVYGMPPALFDSISMYLSIDTAGLRKININSCTMEELKNHPYINWNVANAIVAYRQKHGLYKNVFDIQKTDLVDDDLYRKIAPYLKIE